MRTVWNTLASNDIIPNFTCTPVMEKPAAQRAPATPPMPHPKTPRSNPQQEFFRRYASYAIATQTMTGIPASVTLAQAALESGWGRHAPGHNFFGIKGEGPAGSQWLWTREYREGRLVMQRQLFRKYHDPQESFLDHAQTLFQGRYLRHSIQHTASAEQFIQALQSGEVKYATDPHYVEKILSLIARYGLKVYDIAGKPSTAPQ